MAETSAELEYELEYLRFREKQVQAKLTNAKKSSQTATGYYQFIQQVQDGSTLKRPAEESSEGLAVKKRKLEPTDWLEFWKAAQPLTVPPDPEMDGIPRHVIFNFSDSVTLNMHGLFFQLAAIGELESVGVLSKTSSYAQFVRARDADRAQRECHGVQASQLQTLVQVSCIEPTVAETLKVSVSFKTPVEHATSLIIFEPSPYEEKIFELVSRFWKNVEDKYLQSGQRRFMFLNFSNSSDVQACLVTLQLRLAFDWDIHLQYVTSHEALLPGTNIRSTAEAYSLAQSNPNRKQAPIPNAHGGTNPPLQPFGEQIPPSDDVGQIQVGNEYRGIIKGIYSQYMEIDIGMEVHCTVAVQDVDDPVAFRLLRIDDIIQPRVLAISSDQKGTPHVRMGLTRPDKPEPVVPQAAKPMSLEDVKQKIVQTGDYTEAPLLIHQALRAGLTSWAALTIEEFGICGGNLNQFLNEFPQPAEYGHKHVPPAPSNFHGRGAGGARQWRGSNRHP